MSADWFAPTVVPEHVDAEIISVDTDPDAFTYPLEPTQFRVLRALQLPEPEPDRTTFDRQAARDVILERVRDGGPGDLDAYIVGVLRQVLDLDRSDSEVAARCRGIGDALTLLRALR